MLHCKWPDARGWIGIASFALTLLVLAMLMWGPRELREDEFFKTLATAIVITGFLNGPVSWAYSSTQQGGDLADRNAAIVHENATAGVTAASTLAAATAASLPDPKKPTPVVVTNTEEDPAIVTDAHLKPLDEELPEYAR